MKVSCIGGSPYTPYDVEKSSLVEAWNVQGKAYYDYGRYNTERLPAFGQLDFRVDKMFYWKKCMFGIYLDIQNITASKLRQPRCADEYGTDRKSVGTPFRTTLCHEVYQAGKRNITAYYRHYLRVLIRFRNHPADNC